MRIAFCAPSERCIARGGSPPHAGLPCLLSLLHHRILLCYVVEDCALAGLLQLPRDHNLVEDVVRLVEVEDQVQLANVTEVAVQTLDKVMHRLQGKQLVVSVFDACNEEQACVSPPSRHQSVAILAQVILAQAS
mmetsp:Transcript_2447/g.2838  ORF Transcript_2447/g.2838 Transcript_2447/m.2838 type:complete len:134 (+) Transcript_2447:86-487(+)